MEVVISSKVLHRGLNILDNWMIGRIGVAWIDSADRRSCA